MDHFGLKYVSDFLNNGVRGHANYAFVDIAVNNDTQLFIDTVLLESNHSKWYKNASKVMSSFFDSFCLRTDWFDDWKLDYLLFSYTKISLKEGIMLRIVLLFNKKLTNKK